MAGESPVQIPVRRISGNRANRPNLCRCRRLCIRGAFWLDMIPPRAQMLVPSFTHTIGRGYGNLPDYSHRVLRAHGNLRVMGRVGRTLPPACRMKQGTRCDARLAEDVRASARRDIQALGRSIPCECGVYQLALHVPSTPGLLHGYWAGTPENRSTPGNRGIVLAGTSTLPNLPR